MNNTSKDHVSQITDESFRSFIKENNKVIVLCVRHNCPYCNQYLPIVSTIAQEMDDTSFAQINISKNKKTAKNLNIRIVPTLIIFQNGKVKKGIIGMKSKGTTEKEIRLAFANTFW
ncbi:MAG: thioredoxin family protein [Candidatus Thermoplasmatota archaeon]|nr:thioredoxin family protein [Candidatus Thermoplasmatota archaeon]